MFHSYVSLPEGNNPPNVQFSGWFTPRIVSGETRQDRNMEMRRDFLSRYGCAIAWGGMINEHRREQWSVYG